MQSVFSLLGNSIVNYELPAACCLLPFAYCSSSAIRMQKAICFRGNEEGNS
jgi:hypothetical protein